MSPTVLSPLIARLKVSEGWREHAYIDTTGNLTIGYGHNLGHLQLPLGTRHADCRIRSVNGIPENIGELLLIGDAAAAMGTLAAQPWFDAMDDIRREVLVELVFSMGPKVLGFSTFINQLRGREYRAAAANMRGWPWVKQVHESRALPLIAMLETGTRAAK